MNCGVGILRLKEGFGMGLDGDGTVQNGNSDDGELSYVLQSLNKYHK